jgi:hypothetical protein
MQVQVENLDKFLAAFSKAPESMARECRKAIKKGLTDIQRESASNHSYTTRSGALDKAYRMRVSQTGLDGELFLDGRVSNAPYAYIQHEGGTIAKEKIVPKNRRALRFVSGGAFVFAKKITKDIVIKGGHFLTNAAEKLSPVVYNDINRAISRGIANVGL